eukprot:SAG31_NODE_621_length_13502_cov_18.057002_14_plen_104_part_00
MLCCSDNQTAGIGSNAAGRPFASGCAQNASSINLPHLPALASLDSGCGWAAERRRARERALAATAGRSCSYPVQRVHHGGTVVDVQSYNATYMYYSRTRVLYI